MVVFTINAGFETKEKTKKEWKKHKRLKEKMEAKTISHQIRGRYYKISYVFSKLLNGLYQEYK